MIRTLLSASGDPRSARGSCSTIGTSLRAWSSCRIPAISPAPAIRASEASAAAFTPAAAAFCASTSMVILGWGALDVPVDVDHAGRAAEDVLHGLGDLEPARGVGAVHLGDERLQDGRPRRDLGHLDPGAGLRGQRRQHVAHALGDRVALLRPLLLRDEVDLQVGLVRRPAQEVVADQAVEVVRRRRARRSSGRCVTDGCFMASWASSAVTRAVSSSGVPSGMLTMTWNSLLLSNGSILTVTRPERERGRRRPGAAARSPRGTSSRTRGSPIRRLMNRR